MKHKKGLITTACAMLAFAGATCNLLAADATVTDFSSAREFQGTATPLIQCNLLSGFNDNWRGMKLILHFLELFLRDLPLIAMATLQRAPLFSLLIRLEDK